MAVFVQAVPLLVLHDIGQIILLIDPKSRDVNVHEL